jgi:hypothetical protein
MMAMIQVMETILDQAMATSCGVCLNLKLNVCFRCKRVSVSFIHKLKLLIAIFVYLFVLDFVCSCDFNW